MDGVNPAPKAYLVNRMGAPLTGTMDMALWRSTCAT